MLARRKAITATVSRLLAHQTNGCLFIVVFAFLFCLVFVSLFLFVRLRSPVCAVMVDWLASIWFGVFLL